LFRAELTSIRRKSFQIVPNFIPYSAKEGQALFFGALKGGWVFTLFDLLQQKKIKPLIAQRLPLAEARRAHELLGKQGVTGKIVLLCNGP